MTDRKPRDYYFVIEYEHKYGANGTLYDEPPKSNMPSLRLREVTDDEQDLIHFERDRCISTITCDACLSFIDDKLRAQLSEAVGIVSEQHTLIGRFQSACLMGSFNQQFRKMMIEEYIEPVREKGGEWLERIRKAGVWVI